MPRCCVRTTAQLPNKSARTLEDVEPRQSVRICNDRLLRDLLISLRRRSRAALRGGPSHLSFSYARLLAATHEWTFAPKPHYVSYGSGVRGQLLPFKQVAPVVDTFRAAVTPFGLPGWFNLRRERLSGSNSTYNGLRNRR